MPRDIELGKIAYKCLIEVKRAFDQIELDFIVWDGLLLGLYRDGDQVKEDEDDIDLGVWEKDRHKLLGVVEPLTKKGFNIEVWRIDGKICGLILEKKKVRFHIALLCKRGDNYYHIFRNHGKKNRVGDKDYFAEIFSLEVFDELETIMWKDLKLTTPKIEKFLTEKYYNWKKPRLRSEGYNTVEDLNITTDFIL